MLRDYRKLGIATKLMRACHHAMKTVYKARYVSLHVRVTNRAAFTLYKDVLGYEISSIAHEYYADKEDAYDMKLYFDNDAKDKMSKGSAASVTPALTEEEKKDAHPNAIQTQTEDSSTAATEGGAAAADKKKKKKRNKKKKGKGGAAADDTGGQPANQ